MKKKYCTVKEAGEFLGVSRQAIISYIDLGALIIIKSVPEIRTSPLLVEIKSLKIVKKLREKNGGTLSKAAFREYSKTEESKK